jgi:hypothetical protein
MGASNTGRSPKSILPIFIYIGKFSLVKKPLQRYDFYGKKRYLLPGGQFKPLRYPGDLFEEKKNNSRGEKIQYLFA